MLHYKPTLRHDRLSYINCSCISGLCGKTSIDLMKGFTGIVDSQDYALCTNIVKVIEYNWPSFLTYIFLIKHSTHSACVGLLLF